MLQRSAESHGVQDRDVCPGERLLLYRKYAIKQWKDRALETVIADPGITALPTKLRTRLVRLLEMVGMSDSTDFVSRMAGIWRGISGSYGPSRRTGSLGAFT